MFQEFAAGVSRQLVDGVHQPRNLVPSDMVAQKPLQFGLLEFLFIGGHHEGCDLLTPLRVRFSYDGDIGYARMLSNSLLDFQGEHVLPADDNDVFESIYNIRSSLRRRRVQYLRCDTNRRRTRP